MRRRLIPLLAWTSLALSGCSTPQPAWLTDQSNVLCMAAVSPKCLDALINKHLAEAPEDDFSRRALEHFAVAAKVAGTDGQSKLSGQARIVAEAIGQAKANNARTALKTISSVSDLEFQSWGLNYIARFALANNRDDDAGRTIAKLSETSHEGYLTVLQLHLQNMIVVGDHERAVALRGYLYQQYLQTSDEPAYDMTDVGLVYARTGFGREIPSQFFQAISKLPPGARDDERRLLEIIAAASQGTQPRIEDITAIKTEQTRLLVYVHLSRLYALHGDKQKQLQAIQDVALLSQSASMQLNPTTRAELLTELLMEFP